MGKKAWGYKKTISFFHFILKQRKIDRKLAYRQFKIIESEKPDRVVFNGKSAYPVIWGLKNKGKTTWLISFPYMHYVKNHSHIAFAGNYGAAINKLSYLFVQLIMAKAVFDAKKWLNIAGKLSLREVLNVFKCGKSIYAISPTLIPEANNWAKDIRVLGYHKSNCSGKWHPGSPLLEFMDKHTKLIFVTFGSMVSNEPEKKTQIILDILERNKIPAIVDIGAGGLIEPPKYNQELVFFVKEIPYERIFDKIYAVIHHGGSGTTHLGLKYGCPTLIIPHITDQFEWDRAISEKGLGPKGVNIEKITAQRLEPKVIDLFDNQSYIKKAGLIKELISKEDFTDDLVDFIKS